MEQCSIDNWAHENKVKLESKYEIFLSRNALENVSKLTAILFHPQCVNSLGLVTSYGDTDLGQN